MFQVTGAFAEFERTMIRDRVRLGLKRARANGTRLGRPTVSEAIERKVRAQLGKGTGIIKTAKLLGIGVGTVQRIKDVALVITGILKHPALPSIEGLFCHCRGGTWPPPAYTASSFLHQQATELNSPPAA